MQSRGRVTGGEYIRWDVRRWEYTVELCGVELCSVVGICDAVDVCDAVVCSHCSPWRFVRYSQRSLGWTRRRRRNDLVLVDGRHVRDA